MTSPIPPVLRTAVVARPVDEAFAVFTDEIGAWWPLPTHSVFHDEAGGLHFVDGRLVERAIDGRESTWGEILAWEPPHRLVITWHPGADLGAAGRIEVTFREDDAGTRVDLRHDGWEAFGEDGLRRRRGYAGPSAWGHVLDHFADGAEHRVDGADLTALVAAYDTFFAEAAAADDGGTTAPPDGEWSFPQVVAHVALTDLTMTAVCHALVHRADPVFQNRTCSDRTHLDAVIESCGSTPTLLGFGRRCADQYVAALRRLDPEQLAHPVHCRLEHDGEIALDAPMPWGDIAIGIQAQRHLTAHVDQIAALRTP